MTKPPPGAAGPFIAEIAALVGDTARANMLAALMDGRALTATELAFAAGVAPQTASGHLAKLTEANLLAVERQGRHRYYRLASPLVARMIETVMAVAAIQSPPRRRPPSRVEGALRAARTCYDHLAGRLGVAIGDALVAHGHVLLDHDGASVSDGGGTFFASLGIDAVAGRRPFCRPCLDWSERRPHLAGQLGASICARAFQQGWITRMRDTRAVLVTEAGAEALSRHFGINIRDLA